MNLQYLYKYTCTIFFITFLQFNGFSQPLGGTKTVCTSGCDYSSLAACITALNLNGVASGGLVVEIASGHTETIPSGGFTLGSATLNASLSAANPLTIRTAPGFFTKAQFTSGAGTASMDAMFKLAGVDYVTIDNIRLVEANTNTTSFTHMEYGFSFIKRNSVNPVDGCQFNTLSNCEVLFKRDNYVANYGIYAGNHLATTTTTITLSSVNDAHSNNLIIGNVVTNAQWGIYFTGVNQAAASATLYDQNNKIGESLQGNTIIRFGPNTTTPAAGIFMGYQNNLLVRANQISGGANTFASTIQGIALNSPIRVWINNNTISDTSFNGANQGIFYAGTTSGKVYTDANNVQFCVASGGTLTGISMGAADTIVISNNIVSENKYLGTLTNNAFAITHTGANSKYAAIRGNYIFGNRSRTNYYGINLLGTTTENRITDNRIYSDTCENGNNIAIYNAVTSASTDSIYNNEIFDLINTFNGTVYGYLRPIIGATYAGTKIIEKNKIYGLRTKQGTAKGIEHNNCSGNVWIRGNEIYGFVGDSIMVTLTGIEILNGVVNSHIINNAIYGFTTYTSALPSYMYGIYMNNSNAGNVCRVYHNTVYFNATLSGNLVSYCMRSGIFSDIELRNNVFINTSLATINGFTAAYYREGSNLATYRIGSNNNIYYAGGTPGRRALYFDAVGVDSTLAQFKVRVSGRETESLTENVSFTQAFAFPYQLWPLASVPSQIESGGMIIDTPYTVHKDINGNVRNRRYPDAGCYEGSYLLLDTLRPNIQYGLVQPVNPYYPAPEIQGIATDKFGIRGSNALRPRLYFKKKTDANSFIGNSNANGGWKFVTTTDSVSPFRFTLNYALLNSVLVPGDTLQFFMVAQDSNNNIGAGQVSFTSNPSATNLLPSNFPVIGNPAFIPVFDTLYGTYTIGTGGNFSSITQAFARYEASVQTGPVTFVLTNNLYFPISSGGLERFPLVLRPAVGMSASNTLRLQVGSGLNPLIFGSSDTALLILKDGVKYFTLNGSNNNSNARNLTLWNTHVNAKGVIFMQANNSNGGINNILVQHANLRGGGYATTQMIVIGSSIGITPASTGQAMGAANITLNNCQLYSGLAGVMAVGAINNPIQNLSLINNAMGTDSSNLSLSGMGVYLENVNNAVVNKNRIFNLYSGFTQQMSGIFLGDGVNNSAFKNNLINNITSGNPNSSGCYGIFVSSGVNVNNDSIYNNSISTILAPNSSNPGGNNFNSFGIKINGGTNLKVYYNSVHMSGTSPFGSGPSGSAALQLVGSGPFTGLDIRNNTFSNLMVNNLSGSRQAAFWASVVFPLSGATINYNNYYVNGFGGTLFYDGISNYNTIADMQTASYANAVAFSRNPLYVSNSNLLPNQGGQLNVGIPIAGITRDRLDSVRSNTTPRLGCIENEVDLSPPVFAPHSSFMNNGFTSTLAMNGIGISDSLSGVDIRVGNRPRIYFKKKTDADAFGANNSSFNGWKYVEASNASSPYNFVLNYALLNTPLVLSDSVYYFFVAADNAGNISANPAAGFAQTGFNSITTAPAFPFRFRITAPPLAGLYRVGTGGNFSTLTIAVTELVQRGVSAPVTFLLTQASYVGPSETFPITFPSTILGVSASNTVSIKPAPGVSPVISSNGTPATLYFNGCKYIEINGADTSSKVGRKISIINTVGDAAVLIQNDAQNNLVKNCNVHSEPFSVNTGIISIGNRLLIGNDNNTIDSCLVGPQGTTGRPATCISAAGNTGPSNVITEGLIIKNNAIYNPENYGVYIDNNGQGNCHIIGNSFYKTYTYFHNNNFSFLSYYSASGGTIQNNYFGGTAAFCGGSIMNHQVSGELRFIQAMFGYQKGLVSGNIMRKVNVTQMGISPYHSFINMMGGKADVFSNVIGSDTGNSTISVNYTNTNTVAYSYLNGILLGGVIGTTLDSVDLFQNKIGSILLYGGGLLDFNGINNYSSSGNAHMYENTIGSLSTFGSITQRNIGKLRGIYYGNLEPTSNVNIHHNTIQHLLMEMRAPYASTSSMNGIEVFVRGKALVNNNQLSNLYVRQIGNGNGTIVNAQITGINLGGDNNAQFTCDQNLLKSFHCSVPHLTGVLVGISMSGNTTSNFEVSRNRIMALHQEDTFIATVHGIFVTSTNTFVHSNFVCLGIDSLGNSFANPMAIYGIRKANNSQKVFFNTVKIMGTYVYPNTNPPQVTTAFINTAAAGVDSVYNNIFINERSDALPGLVHHYAMYNSFTPIPKIDRNLIWVDGTNAHLAYFTPTTYNSLDSLRSITNTNQQSRSHRVFFTSVLSPNLSGTSVGDTALACLPRISFGTDINNQFRDARKPYMGCFEATSAPLPVTWLSFEAKQQDKDVLLIWQTASEKNNKGFFVQHSLDAQTFENLQWIKGNGNTEQVSSYFFTHALAFEKANKHYYRLAQHDLNGEATYSNILLVQTERMESALNIWPNPSKKDLFIQTPNHAPILQVKVFASNGQFLFGLNPISMDAQQVGNYDVSALANGLYYLQVETSNGTYYQKLLMSK